MCTAGRRLRRGLAIPSKRIRVGLRMPIVVSVITRFGTIRVIKVAILLLLSYPRKDFAFVGVRGRFMGRFAGLLSRKRVYVVLIQTSQHSNRHVHLGIQALGQRCWAIFGTD